MEYFTNNVARGLHAVLQDVIK